MSICRISSTRPSWFLFTVLALGLFAFGSAWGEEETDKAQQTAEQNTPAAPEPATPPPPPKNPPDRLDLQRGKLLAQQFNNTNSKIAQVHWFNEGTKEAFLGLYTEEFGEQPQGYALVLHDNQQHPDWPGLVNHMRSQLPAGGWSTLAISLPDYWQLTETPPREQPEYLVEPPQASSGQVETNGQQPNNTENQDETENAAPPDEEEPSAPNTTKSAEPAISPPEAKKDLSFTQLSVEYEPAKVPEVVQQRVQAALDFLKNRDPMPIIIIASGTAATWVAKQIHGLRMRDIAGLVIIDPVATDHDAFDVSKDAPGLRIPVLDIIPEFSPRSSPQDRRREARRQGKKSYEQQSVLGSDSSFAGFEAATAKKIRGWAKRVIIDKKRFGYL